MANLWIGGPSLAGDASLFIHNNGSLHTRNTLIGVDGSLGNYAVNVLGYWSNRDDIIVGHQDDGELFIRGVVTSNRGIVADFDDVEGLVEIVAALDHRR